MVVILIIAFIMFVPILPSYYYDSANKEPQQVEVKRELQYIATEDKGSSRVPYVTVKNIDIIAGEFRVLLWVVNIDMTIYDQYRRQRSNDLHPENEILWEDVIAALPPENRVEGLIKLSPQQERIVYYPKILQDEYDAYGDEQDIYDWGYRVDSLTTKKVMETIMVDSKVATKVPLIYEWTGKEASAPTKDFTGLFVSLGVGIFLIFMAWLSRNVK